MKKYKMGRMTNIELQTIQDNMYHKNYIEIAQMLQRNPNKIKEYIEKLGVKTSLGAGKPIVQDHEIKSKEFWPVLEEQFSPPELVVFIYHWDKIQKQFDFDILPTEELQIIDLIKSEILANRNLKSQKEAEDSIRRIQLELEMETDPSQRSEYERQVAIYNTGIGTLVKEYRELQQQKNKLFADLKATRSDRIKRIDSKRESFLSWLQFLIDNPQYRKEKGLYLEKFRLAQEEEERRLFKYHKFDDGKIDQAILNERSIDETIIDEISRREEQNMLEDSEDISET